MGNVMPTQDDETLRRFLLQRTSEQEREQLEEALFANDELFSRAVESEDDLLDEYVRETMSPEERRAFEERLQRDPRLAERIPFARALSRRALILPPNVVRIDTTQAWKRRRVRYMAIAAALAPLLVFGLYKMRDEAVSQPVTVQQARQSAPAVPAQRIEPAPVVAPRIATLTLALATLRSEAKRPEVSLENADSLHLNIAVDPNEPYRKFNVIINDARGKEIWSGTAEKRNQELQLELPASKLASNGRYEVAVRGGDETLGYVEFEVKR
jgi:hypothetical protein